MKNICDWSKCNKIGLYRAPIEKDNSKKFRLLCLEHIKEFNKSKTHLKIIIQSDTLRNLNRIVSHKKITSILRDEIQTKIHSLEIKIK